MKFKRRFGIFSLYKFWSKLMTQIQPKSVNSWNNKIWIFLFSRHFSSPEGDRFRALRWDDKVMNQFLEKAFIWKNCLYIHQEAWYINSLSLSKVKPPQEPYHSQLRKLNQLNVFVKGLIGSVNNFSSSLFSRNHFWNFLMSRKDFDKSGKCWLYQYQNR